MFYIQRKSNARAVVPGITISVYQPLVANSNVAKFLDLMTRMIIHFEKKLANLSKLALVPHNNHRRLSQHIGMQS